MTTWNEFYSSGSVATERTTVLFGRRHLQILQFNVSEKGKLDNQNRFSADLDRRVSEGLMLDRIGKISS